MIASAARSSPTRSSGASSSRRRLRAACSPGLDRAASPRPRRPTTCSIARATTRGARRSSRRCRLGVARLLAGASDRSSSSCVPYEPQLWLFRMRSSSRPSLAYVLAKRRCARSCATASHPRRGAQADVVCRRQLADATPVWYALRSRKAERRERPLRPLPVSAPARRRPARARPRRRSRGARAELTAAHGDRGPRRAVGLPVLRRGLRAEGLRQGRAGRSQIEGDPDSPISRGRLCPKGSASQEPRQQPAARDEGQVPAPARHRVGGPRPRDGDGHDRRPRSSRTRARDVGGRRRRRPAAATARSGWRVLGGATLDTEENYLIKKCFTAAGAVSIENQARI